MDLFNLHIHNIRAELEDYDRVTARRIHRKRLRDMADPFEVDNVRFISNFRLSKDRARTIIQDITPYINRDTSRSHALSPTLKVLITLKYMASGSYQRGCLEEHNILNVSQTSISRSLDDILDAVERRFNQTWVKFPSNNREKAQVKAGFYENFNFPGIVGAIDCTKIRIVRPRRNEEQYFSHILAHCINVQMICDHRTKILNVNARHGGATHDAFIWRHSTIRDHLMRNYRLGNTATWLIGDSGYGIEPWLLTPIDGHPPMDTPEGRYNFHHIRARNVVERLFGILKCRWRCLSKERLMHYSPNKARKIINFCAALHNVALGQDDYEPEEEELANYIENNYHQFQPNDDIGRNLMNEGRERRRNLIVNRFT